MAAADRKLASTDELLTDAEIRARHRRDPEGMERTEEVLRNVREGTANEAGIAGEELQDFLRERT